MHSGVFTSNHVSVGVGRLPLVIAGVVVMATVGIAIVALRALHMETGGTGPAPRCEDQSSRDMITQVYNAKRIQVAGYDDIKVLKASSHDGIDCAAAITLRGGEKGVITYHLAVNDHTISLRITGAH